MATPIQLPYTIQTDTGSVLEHGRPRQRPLPHESDRASLIERLERWRSKKPVEVPIINEFQDYAQYDKALCRRVAAMAIQIISSKKEPRAHWIRPSDSSEKFKANINALRSGITKDHLLELISSKTRLDLEQAAAIIVSAFIEDGRMDDAMILVANLGGVLATSCMWLDEDFEFPVLTNPCPMFEALAESVQKCFTGDVRIGRPRTYAQLIPLMLQIRKARRPDRCLRIPAWMFEEAGIEQPSTPVPPLVTHIALARTPQAPERLNIPLYPPIESGDALVIVSRKKFSLLQRLIYRLLSQSEAKRRLSYDIAMLEGQVQYEEDWISWKLRESRDITQIALWFFHFQRRLQRTIAGNIGSTKFPEKGEGNNLYQNNLSIRSTFEVALSRLAGRKDGVISASLRTSELIARTCLLMKRYVEVYGDGKKDESTLRPDKPEEGEQGPVDEYKRLCNILEQLRKAATREGIVDISGPGAVRGQ